MKQIELLGNFTGPWKNQLKRKDYLGPMDNGLWIGPLHQSDEKWKLFSQIYILDPDEQTRLRMHMNGGLEPHILRKFEEYLRTHNSYVDVFQQSTIETDALNVNIVLKTQHSSNPRRDNAPSVPAIKRRNSKLL